MLATKSRVTHLWLRCIYLITTVDPDKYLEEALDCKNKFALKLHVGCKTPFSLLIHQYTSLIYSLHLSK